MSFKADLLGAFSVVLSSLSSILSADFELSTSSSDPSVSFLASYLLFDLSPLDAYLIIVPLEEY